MRNIRYLLLSIVYSLGLGGCAGSLASTAAKHAPAETTAWRIPSPKESAAWLDKQIIEHPNDPAPYLYERGKKTYSMKEYSAAIDYYSRAIDWYRQHAPTSRQLTDAIVARADAYASNGQSQRAKDDLDAAIAANPDPVSKMRYLHARSQYYRREQQVDLADADSQVARTIMMGTLAPQADAKRHERMEEVRRAQEACVGKTTRGCAIRAVATASDTTQPTAARTERS